MSDSRCSLLSRYGLCLLTLLGGLIISGGLLALLAPLPVQAAPAARGAATTLTYTTYLPLLNNQFKFAPEVYGYVTENGAPVAGVPVNLMFHHDRPFHTAVVTTTATDANGRYNFTNVGTYISDPSNPYYSGSYFVEYQSAAAETTRLAYWTTRYYTTYINGATVNFGNFELAAPTPQFPLKGAIVTPTFTVRWQPRAFAGESYYLTIRRAPTDTTYFYTDWLGAVGLYTATLTGTVCAGQPCANGYNLPLQWGLRLSNTEGSGYTHPTGVFTITVP